MSIVATLGIPFITNLIGKYGEKVVTETVKSTTGIDLTKKELTAEEKQQIIDSEVRIEELAVERLRLAYENTANARETNKDILVSDNVPWYIKIMPFLYDLIIIGITLYLGYLLFTTYIPKSNEQLIYTFFGAMLMFVGTIINYHRGSSGSSQAKNDIIGNIQRRNNYD